MNEVELLFQDKVVWMHTIPVFPKHTAIEFIDECRKHAIDILGMDAFILEGDFHSPSMENSIDFTALPHSKNKPSNIWDAAIAFLKEREDIYYFEIVCEG